MKSYFEYAKDNLSTLGLGGIVDASGESTKVTAQNLPMLLFSNLINLISFRQLP
jgi:hypothetical protein